jgi:hypothetical protein
MRSPPPILDTWGAHLWRAIALEAEFQGFWSVWRDVYPWLPREKWWKEQFLAD